MQFNNEIDKIISTIQNGELILYPTDTVWGIGCDAFNEKAVNKIFSVKQQSREKSFVILVSDQDMLKEYIPKLQPKIQSLVDYHTKPVTVIYEDVTTFPQFLFARDNTIAIRITTDSFSKEIISKLGKPIIATTANITNEAIPKIFNEISPKIINQMDYVVQYRQNDIKPIEPSVIVTLSPKGDLVFLRK